MIAARKQRWSAAAGVIVVVLAVSVIGASLFRYATDGHPMSTVDEHIHLDTQFRVHHGQYPSRGDLIGPDTIHEWACGVGHEGGATTVPCGSPDLSAESLPSGKYTSGYIHYPTYFVAGEGFRFVVDRVGPQLRPIDAYRSFAALVWTLGLALCAVGSWSLGLRGPALVAGTLAPSVGSAVLIYGQMVNPTSTSILLGGAIAWAGLRWVQRGTGFGWLLVATGVASLTAVTSSIPAGAFVILIALALWRRSRGDLLAGPWQPRAWQAAALMATLVLPILIYGHSISARATLPNETLYGFAGFDGWRVVVFGAAQELSALHTPWQEGLAFIVPVEEQPGNAVRRLAIGQPSTLAVLVLGALLLVAVRGWRRRLPSVSASPQSSTRTHVIEPMRLLAIAALLGFVLYPPLLRIANAATMGIDFGIVNRYSISYAPLLVWIALLALRDHRIVTWLLGVVALLGTLPLIIAAW